MLTHEIYNKLSKEQNMENRIRTKPQFDLNEVKKIFLGLNENYVTRNGERVIKIVTRWRRGELKRIEIDNKDM